MSSAEPYDPYIPSGSTSAGGENRTAAIQAQIDDTVGIMRENINKVAARGRGLDDLQDKTDNLAASAAGFHAGANRVRKQMWWKDIKMRMCLIALVIIAIIVVVVVPVATLVRN